MKDPYLIMHYFRFCKMEVDGRKLKRCKNSNLILAIELIGFYKAPYQKKSLYKRGIDYICTKYKLMFNETLYKTEIRRLARPNRKKESCLYFPKKILKILECITSCIDIPGNDTTHKHCMTVKQNFCKNIQRPYLHCYYYLVFELITHMRALEGRMDHRSMLYEIYRKLENHPKRCMK